MILETQTSTLPNPESSPGAHFALNSLRFVRKDVSSMSGAYRRQAGEFYKNKLKIANLDNSKLALASASRELVK